MKKAGEVVLNYYPNPLVPIYGFGASHPKVSDSRNNYFPCSGSRDLEESMSLDEALRKYNLATKVTDIGGAKNLSHF